MAPYSAPPLAFPETHMLSKRVQDIQKPSSPDGLILESWSQGYMCGSLIIMAAITVANMRRGVLLHKLILLELILGTFHGTFIFAHEPEYGWYLSVTAIFLNISWSLHNVIAWIKTKPFLSKKWSWFYIGTVALAQPYWVVEIYANFTYFNNINTLFEHTRPYEALFRDPWWIFSTLNLFWNIHTSYHLPLLSIVRISPRFAVLLTAMTLSIGFIIVDIVSVTSNLKNALPDGLNPFWKLAFVFKCLTDSIVLDDFKTALDRLMRFKMHKERFGTVGDTMAATVGSSNVHGWDDGNGDDMNYRGGEGTTTAAAGGFTKSAAMRRPSRTGHEDPLGEDMMDEDRLAQVEEQAQATAGAQERARKQYIPDESSSDGGAGTNGRDISFWDALNERDLEKNAKEESLAPATAKGAMTQHVQHWDDIDLPAFETSSSDIGGG